MFEAFEWGTYIFFAVFLAAGIVWVWFMLPETMGATHEDMDRIFGSRTGAEDSEMLDQARRDVGITTALEDLSIQAAANEKTTDIETRSAHAVETERI